MIDLEKVPEALRVGVAELARHMQTSGYRRHDPVREIFGILGDRWTMLVLLVLRIGEWRHADLRRVLAQLSSEQRISQRVLTLKLRQLEKNGMVARSVTDDIPPHVSYALTRMGQDLTRHAAELLEWVRLSADEIELARRAFTQQDS